MKDPMGVWRGKCSRCSCTVYQYEENSKRAACSYCECPAPAHEEINDPTASTSNQMLNNLSSSSSSSLSSSSPDILTFHVNEVPFLHELLSSPSSSATEPTSEEIVATFPRVFPKRVQEALASRQLLSTHKDIIVQKVVDGLQNANKLSNPCLQKAAKKMPEKWSPLKSSLDPDNKCLYEKLKRRRARVVKPDKRPRLNEETVPQPEELISPDDAVEEMKRDWGVGKREAIHYRSNMAASRSKRKADAKKMPGLQLFRTYPALGIGDVMLEEFEFEVKVTVQSMKGNWDKVLPDLTDYFVKSKIECSVSGSTAQKTLSILKNLHLVPIWHNKKNEDNNAAKVLAMFPENTALNETMPKAKEPPRLICTGNLEEDSVSICSYLDTEPLFSCEDPFRAMLLLLASYYVLGIKWPAYTRLPLILLTSCTVGPSIVAKDIARNNKLQDLLKSIKVL